MEAIIAILVIIVLASVAYKFLKVKEEKKPIPKKSDKGWVQILADIKTALSGIKTKKDFEQFIIEYEDLINKHQFNPEFMSRYTELVNNWKLKNL